jgi:prepilin signal peptidase PulO-like enzyme (type II secretory pathway)
MNAAAAAFVLGPALALGSFLNVVVARVPARRSIVHPPSSCGSCGTEIRWQDNVPLLSYALLRGRCRHCETRISPTYPIVEALTALLVATCFAAYGVTAWAVLAAGFCSVLVALAAIGAKRQVVPTRILAPAAGAALLVHTAIDPSLAWFIWALLAACCLVLVVLAYPTGFGLDDVKLGILFGAMLGSAVTLALMFGLLAALVSAVVLAPRDRASGRSIGVPLVPFLAVGAVIALLFGDAIVAANAALF